MPSGDVECSAAMAREQMRVLLIEATREDLPVPDSPKSKAQFSLFSKTLHDVLEQKDFSKAESLSAAELANTTGMSAKFRGAIAVEMAEAAIRHNDVIAAHHWYGRALEIDPNAVPVWLDRAKLAEQHGNMQLAQNILSQALCFCPLKENMLIKGIKLQERMGQFELARGMLANLKDTSIEKVQEQKRKGGREREGNACGQQFGSLLVFVTRMTG
jgi:Tfp pilus assembly protein PilF